MRDMAWTMLLLPALIGYLLGSIPFGLLLTRMFGAGDLRSIGSGSIGATNVLRTGRKELAAATLLFDVGKGAAGVLVAQAFHPDLAVLGGFGAIIGHCYPVWLRFRGGKGVATALGIILALSWPIALSLVGVWAAALATSRISSVSSLAAVVAAVPAALLLGQPTLVPLMAAMALLIVWKHRGNIARLRAGTEPRVGKRG